MISELKNNLTNYKIDFAAWLGNLKKSEEDLNNDFMPQALKRIQAALIIRQLALEQKVSVTDQEVEDELNKILNAYPGQKEIIEKANSKAYLDYLKQNLVGQKVMNWLKEKVVS